MDVSVKVLMAELGKSKRYLVEDCREEKRAIELLSTNVNEYFYQAGAVILKSIVCAFGHNISCFCKEKVS